MNQMEIWKNICIPNFKTISDKELLQHDSQFVHHLNPFVYSGYRIPCHDWITNLKTILHIHNESVNIWSHIVGFWLFVGILIKWTFTKYEKVSGMERFATYFYLFSILFLFYVSSKYHLAIGHSVNEANDCQCMDWMGVSLVCCASAVYSGYFEIDQMGKRSDIYFMFLVVLLSLMVFFGLYTYEHMQEAFCNIEEEVCMEKVNESVYFKTFIFCMFSLSTIFTWLIHYGMIGFPKWNDISDKMKITFFGILATYMAYGMVVFKVAGIPERLSPYTFDLFGYSHQIFHFGIVTGALILWITYQNEIDI